MPATSSHTDLLLPATLAAINATRAVLSELLTARAWSEESTECVVLAASEAISNAIEHGSLAGDHVSITISLADTGLDLRVRDTGRRGQAPRPCVNTAAPPDHSDRGRGLLIMRELADEVDLVPIEDGGTEARMMFLADGASALVARSADRAEATG